MLDLLIPFLLLASCDNSTPGEFSLCGSNQTQQQIPGYSSGSSSQETPLRLCSYYANGTIDQPTFTVITAWVEVGSRLCIGDVVPEESYQTSARTIQDELHDQFTAYSNRPFAWWEPGDEVEFEDPALFRVSRNELSFTGDLLGQGATIRFRPVSARWEFSDGQTGSGFSFETSFADVGNYRAQAIVNYEVDYRIGNGSWVQGAASWELKANLLQALVVEYPRRSLLVG